MHRRKQKTMLQNYTDRYSQICETCSTRLPQFSKSYSRSEKLQKEQILDQFLKTIKAFRKERIDGKSKKEFNERLFFENTRVFLRNGLDFSNSQLDLMFSDELIEVTKMFVRQARTFDPDLTFHDIFQACRNLWIMNGLQVIMNIPVQVTPSLFAYSLLYPYTDNLIDDPQISGYEKLIFSERFRDRLSGQILNPINKTENAVFSLVEMIENQYSRTEFPEVYESLLDIHDAQTNSLRLIQESETLSDHEILKICITKGGASVLADGYLVAGKLTAERKDFLFGYGAYLQLLDDIQDLNEDHQAGLMTVFSRLAFQSPLYEKLNKTYSFGEQVMKSLEHFDGLHIDLFQSLMRKSMDLFIIEAIAQNNEAYNPKYISEFEKYSPFHFSKIQKRKEKFTLYHGFLLTAIEEIAFS